MPGGAGNDVVASGINNNGDVAGFVLGATTQEGFVLHNNLFTSLQFPGAIMTLPFGINAKREIVGTYVDSAGSNQGFTYKSGNYSTVDEPNASGLPGTAAFGIDENGDLVGTYEDAGPDQNGFLAQRKRDR